MTRAARGRTQPRLFTAPRRPLTRATTRGFEVVEFAEMIGEPLIPWQAWLVKHALELNPDGSFRFRTVLVLVARQNGKSSVKRVVTLWRLYLDGARLVLGTAQDVAQAREQWSLAKATVHACPDLEAEFGGERNVNGENEFWLTGGNRYMIRALNQKAGRGYSIDEVTIDELRTQKDWQSWAAVSKTIMARPDAQLWAMSNAGDDESVVLNQLRDAALSGRDPSIGLFEWSGKDGCALDDPAAIRQANPALGYLITDQAIRSARGTDPPEVYRTEVLCQRVETLDAAFDSAAWRACADPAGSVAKSGRRLMAAVEVAHDNRHVTLLVGEKVADQTVRVAIVAAWDSTERALGELRGMLEKLRPGYVGWFPGGPGAALAPVLRPLQKDKPIVGNTRSVELSSVKLAEACQELANLIRARGVLHADDPLLNAHIRGAAKQPTGDGWRVVRRDAGHADAAIAAAAAVHLALGVAPAGMPRIRMLG